MSKILKVRARQVFDSRGNPTVAVDLSTKHGVFTAKVPSGASTGVHEALELRDNGFAYGGKGVRKAINNVNKKIAKKLIGINAKDQFEIDKIMIALDGTENKSRLGANAILGVSMATCRAGAKSKNIPLYKHIAELYNNKKLILPIPAFNVINGGEHAGNKLEIQEYMLLPTGAKSFAEAMRIGTEIYHQLKSVIARKYKKSATAVGDEGGFAPPISSYEEPFKLIEDAISQLGYEKKVKLGMDAAASYFFKSGRYTLNNKRMSAGVLAKKYEDLVKNHPLVSIEDPFQEEGFESFANLTKAVKRRAQIVGDDLLVTNVERIKKAIQYKSCNALLLKVNQIGSVSEALDAARLAQKSDWKIMVSHRSGETTDDFIADLVVGLGCGQIKSGAPCRGERLAKYNRLLKIEDELGRRAQYAKW